MVTKIKVKKYHPGELILEELNERGWTSQLLAQLMGESEARLNRVIIHKERITVVFAYNLGRVFNTSHELWLNLQRAYDESEYETKTL